MELLREGRRMGFGREVEMRGKLWRRMDLGRGKRDKERERLVEEIERGFLHILLISFEPHNNCPLDARKAIIHLPLSARPV